MCLALPLFCRNNMDIILWVDSPQLALAATPSPSLQPSAYSPLDLIVFTNFNSIFRLSYRVYDGKKAIFYFFHSNLRWEVNVLSEPTPKRKTPKTWTVLVVQLRHLLLLPPEIGHYGICARFPKGLLRASGRSFFTTPRQNLHGFYVLPHSPLFTLV